MGGSGDHEVLQPNTKDHNEGDVEFLAQTSKGEEDVVDVKGKCIVVESDEENDDSDEEDADSADEDVQIDENEEDADEQDDDENDGADAEEVAGETDEVDEDEEIPRFVIPDDPTEVPEFEIGNMVMKHNYGVIVIGVEMVFMML